MSNRSRKHKTPKSVKKSTKRHNDEPTIPVDKQEMSGNDETTTQPNTNTNNIAGNKPRNTKENIKREYQSQDQFFNFFTDQHGNPIGPISRTQTTSVQESINSYQTNGSTESGEYSSNNGCIIACVFFVIALIFISIGFAINYGLISINENKKYSNDKNYPECSEILYNKLIKPEINHITLDNLGINKHYKRYIDYDLLKNIKNGILNDKLELFLLYGGIDRHFGTKKLFNEINKEMPDKNLEIYIIETATLIKYNGTLKERIRCLYKRFDNHSQIMTNKQLIVVFDHLSHYYIDSGKHNDGMIWSDINDLQKNKNNKNWKLFLVQSNPDAMTWNNVNWGSIIFGPQRESFTQPICVPFFNTTILLNMINHLNTFNKNMLTININKTNDLESNIKSMKYHAFDSVLKLYDSIHMHVMKKMINITHNNTYTKPIILQYNDILNDIKNAPNSFMDDDGIRKIIKFAKSVQQQTCFQHDTSLSS